LCKQKLSPDGVLVTQSGPGGILSAQEVFAPIYRTVATVFGEENTHAYAANIPSFLDDYGFTMAFKNPAATRSPLARTIEEIDQLLDKKIKGGLATMKFYDGVTHTHIFNLMKPIRQALKSEKRVISSDNYVFMPCSEGGKFNMPVLL